MARRCIFITHGAARALLISARVHCCRLSRSRIMCCCLTPTGSPKSMPQWRKSSMQRALRRSWRRFRMPGSPTPTRFPMRRRIARLMSTISRTGCKRRGLLLRRRSMRSIYNYAVIRVVPRVERAEFINAGVILDCQEAGFLDARIELDETRLLALDPQVDLATVRAHLGAIQAICAGGTQAG